MGEAQGRYRWQRVKNVSHGAQAHHKQTKAGLRVQVTIFAQRNRRSRDSIFGAASATNLFDRVQANPRKMGASDPVS